MKTFTEEELVKYGMECQLWCGEPMPGELRGGRVATDGLGPFSGKVSSYLELRLFFSDYFVHARQTDGIWHGAQFEHAQAERDHQCQSRTVYSLRDRTRFFGGPVENTQTTLQLIEYRKNGKPITWRLALAEQNKNGEAK